VQALILAIAWGGALAGVALKLTWIDAPKGLISGVYIALGWAAVATVTQLPAAIGLGWFIVLAAGGVLYTAGGVIYAWQRPDPVPAVFGYHEVFHALVLAAAGMQYAVIAFAVLPRG
jgi:hemolysin III